MKMMGMSTRAFRINCCSCSCSPSILGEFQVEHETGLARRSAGASGTLTPNETCPLRSLRRGGYARTRARSGRHRPR
jgi:hypothetical protein